MGYKRPESVLVVLYAKNGQVLILQRNDDPEFWQSVTGSIEDGETPIETAYREVFEETGIQLSASHGDIIDCRQIFKYEIREQWRYRYPPGSFLNTEYVFSAQIDPNQPLRLTEHSAYKWVSKAEAVAQVWSPSNRCVIESIVPEVQ
jgi:dATP pyrophosphohydrolase